jgi:hypothetical protein
MLKFYRLVDHESTDPARSVDGGDYSWGRVVAVKGGTPVGVYHWSSAGFPHCPRCGGFGHTMCDRPARGEDLDFSGGKDVPPGGDDFETYERWFSEGRFATPA